MIDVQKYIDIVSHPGEFEGEEPWVPYYWDAVLDGDAYETYYVSDDEDGAAYDVLEVEPDEKEAFADWGLGDWVVLYDNGDGFTYAMTFSTYEQASRYIQKDLELDSEDAEENQALMQREASNNE
jgi:hypothetical protein